MAQLCQGSLTLKCWPPSPRPGQPGTLLLQCQEVGAPDAPGRPIGRRGGTWNWSIAVRGPVQMRGVWSREKLGGRASVVRNSG